MPPFGSALKKHEYVESGIPVWGIDNISVNQFSETDSLFITPEKFSDLKRYKVQEGDILISRAGTVGRMCVYDSKIKDSIIGSNLIRLRLNSKILHPTIFSSMYSFFPDRLEGLRTAGDEKSYSFLNTTKLSDLRVYFPSQEAQEKFLIFYRYVREQHQSNIREQQAISENLFNALLQRAFKGQL